MKEASEAMEWRRLGREREDLLRVVRVVEREVEAEGKRMEAWLMGSALEEDITRD